MLDPNTWEELTEDRMAWRAAPRSGIEASGRAFLSKLEDKRRKRKMAAFCNPDLSSSADRLNKDEMKNANFGRGKIGVLEALAIHHSKVKDIAKFQPDLDGAAETKTPPSDELSGIYDSVKAVSDKRGSCLELLSQIASLEDHVHNLSLEFDARAVYLASTTDVTKYKEGFSQSNESLAKTTQGCISSVRENWKWIFELVQCTEVHLRNAATYQEFFQEVQEAEYWMNTTLSQINQSLNKTKDLSDLGAFLQEINDVLTAYTKWQIKIDYLFDKAKQVVPVPLRIKTLPSPRPVIALTDFKSSEVEFIEGEALILLDNSDRKKWQVKTERGQIGFVPSVIILFPPPETEALNAVIRLRLQLLTLWTSSVKTLGFQIIALLLLTFREWSDEEVKLLRAMKSSDKRELLRILLFIEERLGKHWSNYGRFQKLRVRISRLSTILEESLDEQGDGNSFSDSLFLQAKTLESLLSKYQQYWEFWEIFKSMVELLRQPKYLLICDKWEQLKFVTSGDFAKFWDSELDFDNDDLSKTEVDLVGSEIPVAEEEMVSTDVTIQESKEEMTTDTVTSTLEEEQHTFIIKGVLDPRDNKTLLGVEDAIKQGILDKSQKHYINPTTGKTMTLADAMNDGLVIVEFVSKKKIREESNSYGLITITITKETKPYTIKSVLDPVTDEKLSVAKATANKILDTANSTYRTETGELISIADAIHSGLVLVEYHEGETDSKPPEVVTKTYLVYGVVDQKKKQKVSFSEAVRDGLLARDTGEYVNNVTNDRVAVHEAILKGLIKARIATDPSKLEVNPENTIIVEKLASTKAKLLKSVQSVKAFKNAV